MIDSGVAFDFGQLVMDDEFARMIRHAVQGVRVSDETMAVDDIAAVGPAGDFLSLDATLRHMRALSRPVVLDRRVREDWEARGASDLAQRSRARALEILEGHTPAPVDADQAAQMRLNAAYVGTAIAEYFREQGKSVILMMDSVTRFAWAQREVGLASGEPPTRNGYTPSVFAALPRLLERAGCSDRGSITGLYTVLVEGDDLNDPAADAARSILDGHVVLSRSLAARGHYPAIDVLPSVSRLMSDLAAPSHRAAAQKCRQLLADYQETEDLINLGAYVAGSNPRVDEAIARRDALEEFLCQRVDEPTRWAETLARLGAAVGQSGVETPA